MVRTTGARGADDELNVLISEPTVCNGLSAAMDSLFADARRVARGERLLEESEWYDERKAWLDELFQ